MTPGRHRVTARAAGHGSGERALEVAARGRAVAHIALVPATASAAAPATTAVERTGGERAGGRPWKWIALGAGVVAAGAGAYFGITAISDWREVEERCPDDVCTRPADIALSEDARRAGTRSNIAFGVGGAALVAALLLWRFEPGRSSHSISIAPHTSGGLLCLSGRL